MRRTLTNELKAKVDTDVLLKGWLHNFRKLGSIAFLVLRDRGGFAQIIIESKEEMEKLSNLYTGTILEVQGKSVSAPKSKYGYEVQNGKVKVLVPVTFPSPIDISKEDIHGELDTMLDLRPVVIRHPKIQAVFKVQAGILTAFADSMRVQGFMEFRNPILLGAASESGASVFEVNYFDGKAYLAQSPQFYKQIMVGGFERVFTIGTVFRAEKHNTVRHLMEITQMDGEMGFIDSYEEVLDVIERTTRHIFDCVGMNYKEELALWNVTLPKLPEGKFPRIKVKEALKIIEERTGKSAKREELDLDPEDEREIAKYVLEKYDSDFLWLLNFKANKNFYTWNNEVGAPSVTKETEDKDESLSYDLECRGLEWLSGTHRIHIYEKLVENMKLQGLSGEDAKHYLMAFQYGMPSEAGFSFGLERMTKQIFGFSNIREATLFPSDLKRVAGAVRKGKEDMKYE
ncbi:MAG: aspartate--tRNA(Asn) ligase [bacterium]